MPTLSPRHRRLLSTLLLLIASPGIAASQALVSIVAVGSPADPNLSQVITQAAGVEINGLPEISTFTGGTTGIRAGQAAGGTAATEETSADFLLIINYTHSGATVDLNASLHTVGSATTIAERSTAVPFDLNLDTKVSTLVGELIADPKVQSAIRAAAAARQQAKSRAKPRKSVPPSAKAKGSATTQKIAEKSPAASTPAEVSNSLPKPRWAFSSSLGGSPLILVGTASNYFRYGAGASLFAGARFPFARTNLETGITAEGTALFPAVGQTAGMVYAVLGGAQVRVGTPPSLPVGVGLEARGGAAIIIVQPTGAAMEAKTDLFAGGGLTANLRLYRSLTVGMAVGVLVIFEERYPLIAVEPLIKLGF